jgi:hypothetical protein
MEELRKMRMSGKMASTAVRARQRQCRRLNVVKPGRRRRCEEARWEGRGDSNERCSGYCSDVLVHTASVPTRMYDIFRFATVRYEGSVVCARGKHRSVSAGKILELCFHRRVDFSLAARNHPCQCNREGTANHVYAALRALPPPRHARSLAQAMGWMHKKTAAFHENLSP